MVLGYIACSAIHSDMPYIDPERRLQLWSERDGTFGPHNPLNAGELNYVITKQLKPLIPILKEYLLGRPRKYQTWNDILGAFMGAVLELIRRAFPEYADYEDEKIKENGDVY